MTDKPAQRLAKITLDEGSIGRSSPDIEHERAVAIYDLLEENTFAPVGQEVISSRHRCNPAGPGGGARRALALSSSAIDPYG
jgi:uncharacterized protein (UPF0262 family)